jgi:hypothetical protein
MVRAAPSTRLLERRLGACHPVTSPAYGVAVRRNLLSTVPSPGEVSYFVVNALAAAVVFAASVPVAYRVRHRRVNSGAAVPGSIIAAGRGHGSATGSGR